MIMSDGEKLHTKCGIGMESEGFQELTNLVNDVSQQFQESIIKMIDKVNNKIQNIESKITEIEGTVTNLLGNGCEEKD
ncbi:hypothetical protein P879_06943 [Paragonimus westermani]|uniref:Uncharacterized protein n=1 Tax=Paragonimus westermani TaxID=34504 RepID=A0A8T0DPR5_9TREM|nr:hypothetical protein P879_06943 [Paragonimus westermani]